MAAVVDICNTALGHLGDDATVASIDPPDGSVQAGHCARFYPLSRDELLEMHSWRFNTQRAMLALAADDPPVGWAFAYALPSLTVQPIAVLMPTQLPDMFAGPSTGLVTPSDLDAENRFPFIVEASPTDGTPILYTNVENATLIYKVGVTDSAKFTPLFTAALARLLAAKLAGPIIKGMTGANVAKEQLRIFNDFDLPNAVKSDSNARQSSPYSTAVPAPIAARY